MGPHRAAALLALISTPLFAASAEAATTCRLVADGATVIEGSCRFEAMEDGSFTIHSLDGLWFAYVLLEGGDLAQGFWNGEAGAGHAHSPLGTLRRDEGCWSNAASEVCAWR